MNVTADLLLAAQQGERKAQYDLYRLCFPVLMAVCMRYKRDEQEAVASLNGGYLKILNNLGRYHAEVPFEAWIRRIMINTLIDEFRRDKKWRDQTIYSDKLERERDEEPVDWNEADKRFDYQQLENLLHRLPPVTGQVFNLFALDGFSHAEISAALGMSEGTSKWHVNSARKQLQNWIRTELIESKY
ncbi:MAG: RNA polymerase sigma factor [Saprospiraceae bacterium]|nr:RNA polymerase sigma factor [Saprospiraceae bacterium]